MPLLPEFVDTPTSCASTCQCLGCGRLLPLRIPDAWGIETPMVPPTPIVPLSASERQSGVVLGSYGTEISKVGCHRKTAIVIDVAAASGRPLSITLDDRKHARIHDRVMELLVDVQRRVFETATPNKIVELFKLGEGTPLTLGIKASDVVDGFYSFLGFPRLINGAVVKKAIAKGIQDGFVGYYSGSTPALGGDGRYQVPVARVRFNTTVGEDEVDLESGSLMTPQAVPVATPPATAAGAGQTGQTGGGPELILTPLAEPDATSVVGGSVTQKSVEFSFSADRDQLFSAWNAIANLADLAGKVSVTVRADSAEGFDKGKLQNGVLEPLRESDLIE